MDGKGFVWLMIVGVIMVALVLYKGHANNRAPKREKATESNDDVQQFPLIINGVPVQF